MLKFESENGTFILKTPGFSAKNGVLSISTDRFTLASNELSWKEESDRFVAGTQYIQVEVSKDSKRLSVTVKNSGSVQFKINEITLVSFPWNSFLQPLCCAEHLQYVHHLSCNSAGVRMVGRKTAWSAGDERSSMVTVFTHCSTGKTLLIGSLPRSSTLSWVDVLHSSGHREGNFGFSLAAEYGAELPPGSEVHSSFIFLSGDDPLKLLTDYGDKIAEQSPPRQKTPLVGWTSWDYYSGAVRRSDLDENLEAAVELFGDTVSYFIIDAGWQNEMGVWEANWKFPEGLGDLCSHIKDRGKIPGIWTSPFFVSVYTPLYRHHPELFACDEHGSPVITSNMYAYMDTTHPRVITIIEETFSKLHEYGIEYFKIDFLVDLLKCVRFHDPTVPRGEIVRRGVEAIRRAIGDKSYLMACGAPFESVVGLVDAARVSGDIHTYWSHVKRNANCISSRFWMHGRLWINDPDFFVVRSTDTSDDPIQNRMTPPRPYDEQNIWLSGRPFNLQEAKTYALLLLLCGGELFLGDSLRKLKPNGIALIRRVLDHRLSGPAVPIDLFDPGEDIPARWVAVTGDKAYVGIFNWKDYERSFNASPEVLGIESFGNAVDFWTDEHVSSKELCNLRLQTRSSRGLIFKRKAHVKKMTI